MATLTITNPSPGEAQLADITNAFDEIETWANGNIANANIAAAAGIELSKLGQSSAATNDYAQWNGSAWVPAAISATVVTGSPATGNLIRYDGANWAAFQPPACRAVRAASQSISNNTSTAVAFNEADDFDNASLHSTSVNNTRITIGTAGIYSISGGTGFSTGGSAELRNCYLTVNGVTKAISEVYTTTQISLNVTTHLSLAASDYVELYVYQHSGSTRTITSSYLSVVWLSHV